MSVGLPWIACLCMAGAFVWPHVASMAVNPEDANGLGMGLGGGANMGGGAIPPMEGLPPVGWVPPGAQEAEEEGEVIMTGPAGDPIVMGKAVDDSPKGIPDCENTCNVQCLVDNPETCDLLGDDMLVNCVALVPECHAMCQKYCPCMEQCQCDRDEGCNDECSNNCLLIKNEVNPGTTTIAAAGEEEGQEGPPGDLPEDENDLKEEEVVEEEEVKPEDILPNKPVEIETTLEADSGNNTFPAHYHDADYVKPVTTPSA